MGTKKTVRQEGWLTSKRERASYIVGEIGRVCEGNIVTSFMTLFLVFQGIELTLVAGVMLAVKIIDAVNDVAFGYLVDRIKITEWKLTRKIAGSGKYLPWFRLTFALFPLFTVLFFLMPTTLSMTGKLIWFAVFYILYDFAYTLVEVPMNSMMVTLTDNMDERNHIIQNKTIIGAIALILVQVLWMALVSEYVGIALRVVAIVSSVVFFFTMLPLATKVREHNTSLASVAPEETSAYSFKDMLNCVKTNKYLLVLLLSTFLMSGLATGGAVGVFVSYYHFKLQQLAYSGHSYLYCHYSADDCPDANGAPCKTVWQNSLAFVYGPGGKLILSRHLFCGPKFYSGGGISRHSGYSRQHEPYGEKLSFAGHH